MLEGGLLVVIVVEVLVVLVAGSGVGVRSGVNVVVVGFEEDLVLVS